VLVLHASWQPPRQPSFLLWHAIHHLKRILAGIGSVRQIWSAPMQGVITPFDRLDGFERTIERAARPSSTRPGPSGTVALGSTKFHHQRIHGCGGRRHQLLAVCAGND
jgi:hypothetical protein